MSIYSVCVRDTGGNPVYPRGVRKLRIAQRYPGGFHTAQFEIDRRSLAAYTAIDKLARLTVSKGPVVLFDGEIRDVSIAWGTAGEPLSIRAYGFGILLRDDLFGPRIYADNRLDRWQKYTKDNAPGGAYSAEHAPEKFEAGTDNASFNGALPGAATTPKLRIAPKSGAVFSGATAGSRNWEGYFYELPYFLATNGAKTYVAERIVSVTLTHETVFIAGSWELQLFGLSSSGTAYTHTITAVTAAVTTATYTLAGLGWTDVVAVGVALKAMADQACYDGYIDDGPASTPAHVLEYGGNWLPDLNVGSSGSKGYHNRGGMIASETSSIMTLAKDGNFFYPDLNTRSGAAARLRFTGRTLKMYAQKWSAYGEFEYRLFNKSGTQIASGTASEYNQSFLTGTVTFTSGSATVTGAGTAFTTELAVGDLVAWNADGQENHVLRKITAIASDTSLTVDVVMPSNYSSPLALARKFQKLVLDLSGSIASFDTYVLTIRNLGTQTSPALTGQYTNVDYFDVGVAGMQPFADGALFARVYDPIVKTTASTINASLVAADVVAKYAVAAIGLDAATAEINPDGVALPDLSPLVFDDPIPGDDVLDKICEPGTSGDLPLAWAVWEDKRLVVEAHDTTGARGYYLVDPSEGMAGIEQTLQDRFALTVAPVYQDKTGQRRIGVDVGSSRRTDEYAGRQRRVVLSTGAKTGSAAATEAQAYLANHDKPTVKARLTLRRPLRDHAGAFVPLDEVRAGRLLKMERLSEDGVGGSDLRTNLAAIIVASEYDVDAQTLTLDLGDRPDDYGRWVARVRKLEEREGVR